MVFGGMLSRYFSNKAKFRSMVPLIDEIHFKLNI